MIPIQIVFQWAASGLSVLSLDYKYTAGEFVNKKAFEEKGRRVLHAVQTILQENIGFIVALFLLNYTTTAWSLWNQDKLEVMVCYGFSLFFAAFAVAALVQILYNPVLKRLVKLALLAVTGSIFVVEFFAMYNYNILIGAGIVNSIFETNYREAVEFLEMYVGPGEVIGAAGLVAALYYCKARFFTDGKRPRGGQPNRVSLGLLALGFVYTVRMALVYGEVFTDNQYIPLQRAYASAQVALKNIEAYNTLAKKLNDEITLTENKGKIKNIVWIMGESTNRNHMGLYGYALPTTPRLKKRRDDGELLVFEDVISPHSTTIASLSKLFTFCDYESEKEWYEYSNLINVMNAAGYKTFWLSNQESSGIWGNVAQLFAGHSQVRAFTRIRESREDYGVEDGELFPVIDKALAQRGEKNFFVIHLMGAHGAYYNRYPYAFTKFSAKDIPLDVCEDKKAVVAQYDNAVYYNDYVVDEILKRFEKEETLVLYLSDHGEAVYDENGFAGHIEENPNRHMIEIPMLFWGSPSFRQKYPEKIERIRAALDRPYMTDDVMHTLLDLIDVKTAEFDPKKSVVNDEFDASRKRIFNEKDYDRQIRCGDPSAAEPALE